MHIFSAINHNNDFNNLSNISAHSYEKDSCRNLVLTFELKIGNEKTKQNLTKPTPSTGKEKYNSFMSQSDTVKIREACFMKCVFFIVWVGKSLKS